MSGAWCCRSGFSSTPLTLRHTQHNERPLADSADEVLKHVTRLWGFPVHLESVGGDGEVKRRWSVAPPAD